MLSKLSEELERERGLREGLEASLAKALADAEREITRLPTEGVDTGITRAPPITHCRRTLQAARGEGGAAEGGGTRREREAALFRQKSLEEEVKRLRSVQEDVLVQGGALPGGEVRNFLEYQDA